jgi:anti-sigma regulatory factor (Ser/Thr protein kinase)
VELFLQRDARSVGVARRAIESLLAAADFDRDIVDAARVLVSELVTNALQHGQGTPLLCMHHGTHRVRIEVADDGPTLIALDADDGTTGYGLRLLEAFATRWGIESTRADGKKVWFELDACSGGMHRRSDDVHDGS